LISKNEIPFTEVASKKYFTIHPSFQSAKIKNRLKLDEFSSCNTTQLNKDDLLKLLKKESWLFK